MSTTHSGRLLLPQNYGVPLLHDIAIQSGRIPRFAGACRVHWTLLHHLITCSELGRNLFGIKHPSTLGLLLLLHDSDEIATSDIPTQWKAPEQRRLVDPLQARVLETYMGRLPDPTERTICKRVDLLALTAEAIVVGPPGVLEHSGLNAYADAQPAGMLERATSIVNDVQRALWALHHTMLGTGSSGVWWYLRLLRGAGVRNVFGEALEPPPEHQTAEKSA